MAYTIWYESPVGKLLLAEHEEKLVGVWIEGQKYFLGALQNEDRMEMNTPLLHRTCQWLDRYFAGEKPLAKELPLAPKGSAFQKEVWEILCEIPYGQVMTYGAVAKKMALCRGSGRMSAQAVGGAVGHNPLAIIIPCHRVVGSDGSLTGYAGGIEKKAQLLEIEGVDVAKISVPETGIVL